MPIYEYKCAECEAHVEKMQKVSDAPLIVCEVCGGKMEKQWSLSGFQLKGEGWYVTDYSNKTKESKKSETGAQPENTEKTDKTDKTEKSENTEKTSAAESTAKTESASNKSNDSASSPKKDAAMKKD